MASNQVLTGKDNGTLKSIVRLYEEKQYKRGVKMADQLLRKHPDHGETLSMKGIHLANMGKKEEGLECIKRGLRCNIRSHVCWHVFGLFHRLDRNYGEAIKCYLNALRIDKDNMPIMRDLALLQVQMRDTARLVDTNSKRLKKKSDDRALWIGLAVSLELNGNIAKALHVLALYEGTMDEAEWGKEGYEVSELVLYKVDLLEKDGQTAEALAYGEKRAAVITDKMGWRLKKASLLAAVGRNDEAAALFRELVDMNPENHAYHHGLVAALGATTPDRALALYTELQAAHPRSLACFRLALDVLHGDAFVTQLHAYAARMVVKGVPALFRDLVPLYADDAKRAAVFTLFTTWHTELTAPTTTATTTNTITPPAALAAAAGPECTTAAPTWLLWVLYFLAQHHNHAGDHQHALALITAAIEHTPTLPDLYLARADIFAAGGSLSDAADSTEEARRLDLADRFLNNRSVETLLAAGRIEEAERVVSLFTKDDQYTSFADLQVMWYELAIADAWRRRKEYGRALKQFHAVEKHINDIVEDQFDFHAYCLRKMTLRTYMDMLRTEDNIFHTRYYVAAARGAVDVYTALHDIPAEQAAAEDAEYADMSDAEKRKARRKKAKEAKKRAAREETERAARAEQARKQASNQKSAGGDKKKKIDTDPDGRALAAVATPLDEATRFLTTLLKGDPHVDDLVRAARVYTRKGKLLLAARALLHANAPPHHPQVFVQTVALARAAAAAPPTHAAVRAVLQRACAKLLGGQSLDTFTTAFAATTSLTHRIAALEAAPPASAAATATTLFGAGSGDALAGGSLAECTHALTLVGKAGAPAAVTDAVRAGASKLFPFAKWE